MKNGTIILTSAVLLGLAASGIALTAQAETREGGKIEAQMFQAAKISLQAASNIALKELAGTLSAIGFNNENGQGVYEAVVIGTDGTTSIVKIDANSGAILGKGLAAMMADEQNYGENGQEGAGNEQGGE